MDLQIIYMQLYKQLLYPFKVSFKDFDLCQLKLVRKHFGVKVLIRFCM